MKNVLIVDDEKLISDVMYEFFERIGFKADVANDLASGMAKNPSDYDLVILDISLKDETSFPLLEKIKKETPEVPVLMFSGYDNDENIRLAKKLGADGFIPKPFRIEFLQDFLLPKIESIRRKKEGRGKA